MTANASAGDSTAAVARPHLGYPSQITLRWLIDNVPLHIWAWFFGLLGSFFSIGVAFATLPTVQGWFTSGTIGLQEMGQKLIYEKDTYTVKTPSQEFKLWVKNVSIDRKLVEVRVSMYKQPDAEHDISLSAGKEVHIGDKRYGFTVVALSKGDTFRPDAALVKFAELP